MAQAWRVDPRVPPGAPGTGASVAPVRVLTRYVNLILDTVARTVGVNAGARVISGSATPVGIGVNVSP